MISGSHRRPARLSIPQKSFRRPSTSTWWCSLHKSHPDYPAPPRFPSHPARVRRFDDHRSPKSRSRPHPPSGTLPPFCPLRPKHKFSSHRSGQSPIQFAPLPLLLPAIPSSTASNSFRHPSIYIIRSLQYRSSLRCALPTAPLALPTTLHTKFADSPDPSPIRLRRCSHPYREPFPNSGPRLLNETLHVPRLARRDALAPPHKPAPDLSDPPQSP